MTKQTMEIWGRSLDIEILYDCYADEEVLDTQRAAYSKFMEQAEHLLPAALPAVKEYCLKNNRAEIGEDEILNIFKYVKPKTLFIKRTRDGARKVALLCAYKFNPDDGLAVVFYNEELSAVGTENIIL